MGRKILSQPGELKPALKPGKPCNGSHLLGTDQIESALEEFILEKTEGIPFFIEEFIKSLRDLGIIERKDNTYRIAKDIQTVTIPATIQDVIMARVDSLP